MSLSEPEVLTHTPWQIMKVQIQPHWIVVHIGPDSSFEYPQHMFWLRNKKSNFSTYS